MRVFVISDVHTDYDANFAWLGNLSTTDFQDDAVIVAGDVSDTIQIFRKTMVAFKERFKEVLYVAGNHDLWCRGPDDPKDSLAKLAIVEGICKDLGVHIRPVQLSGVWFVPFMSWHHQSFDTEADVQGYAIPPVDVTSMDYKLCYWPDGFDAVRTSSVAQMFDKLNDDKEFASCLTKVKEDGLPVISFSHFLPRLELCPEKRYLYYPPLPKVVGSNFLEARVRALHGSEGGPQACHVFGHTHFGWDATLEGIRYIQAPLAYPKERAQSINGSDEWLPYMLYDSKTGTWGEQIRASHWTKHYQIHPRNPSITDVAPYVKKMYPAL